MLQKATGDLNSSNASASDRWLIDPLDGSAVSARGSAISDVEILRIVLVAVETGARFQRDGIALDPLAWMVTPRRMFDGRPAIEACGTVDACSRALLVHGLGLGLDPDPEAIELLFAEEEVGQQMVPA